MSKKTNILIIEDIATDAELVQREVSRTLPQSNFQCIQTEAEFLDALENFKPDIILSDYTLPQFNGLAALRLSKKHIPEIPFILITGSINEETAVNCMKAGACDYLIKEHITRLGPAVLNAMEQRKLREDAERAARELKGTRAIIEAALTSMTDGLYIADVEGNCIECNDAFARFFKFQSKYDCPKTHQAYFELLEGFDKQGKFIEEEFWPVHRALQGETVTNEEYTIRRKDTDEVCEGSFSFSPIRDERDSITGAVLVIRDIAELKKAKAERERLIFAVEQAGEMIVITDAEGIIQYVNPFFEEITGYTSEEAIGKNPNIVKSGKHDETFYKEMWQTLSRGESWRGRMHNRHKDGSLYIEDATISPVMNKFGKVENYVAVKHDITEKIRLENELHQSQKMESIGRLAGGVAHDFNNLLMGIMGYADLCKDQVVNNPVMSEYLDAITDAAERSAGITRQLLAFARKQNIQPRIIDLNENIENMLKLIRRLLGEDIEIRWSPGSEQVQVNMDPSQIDQILANLAVNARDAIEGVGILTIETDTTAIQASDIISGEDAAPGDYVKLSMGDTGCGMSKSTISEIFEPFFTTKAEGMGTGLGLATVYGIVKQNNGFIRVNSEVGQGTTFEIYFPRIETLESKTDSQPSPSAVPSGTETILIAEDEGSIRETNKLYLQKLNYHVLAAENPEAALRLAAGHVGEIDLLLTDVVMPGMNGVDLAQRLGKRFPDMKCLFMSGFTPDIIAQRGILQKEMDFMAKPFSLEKLAYKVREVLDAADS
ncbi:response regulator [Kiritimatiellaeota bacterium B1221]|nr:response regulator [Kiritimatiellaeota bacterium B1221]